MTSNRLEKARRQALQLDRLDPLGEFREKFWISQTPTGNDQLYFCGNSLGLQPKGVQELIQEELENWRERAVEGHFKGQHPWMFYPDNLREPMAELVGAKPTEVVLMNSLTVNLHLMMVSFYRPRGQRQRIVLEHQPFPSDRYAVESQIRLHGLDPAECLVELGSGGDPQTVDESVLEEYLARHGEQVALVLWPGVQYATGQVFDLGRITAAAHLAGALCGLDLAHAVGNVPLSLHDSGADFAAWCSYKYLNSGPGAVAGCFVHERHHQQTAPVRLQGWWGNAPESRFLMGPDFVAATGADAWQISCPSVLSMAPVRVSLSLFQQAGMTALRKKSIAMTGFLEQLVQDELGTSVEIITPAEPERRGCQLSLRMRAGRAAGRQLFEQLEAAGTIPDWREPDIIRIAPVPLYNHFEECWRFVNQVKAILGD